MAMRLETRHTKAAQRIAAGVWHMERIAKEAGVSRWRLYEWLAEADFQALIEQQRAILNASIVKRGIADKQTRVNGIVERHQRLQQVIEYRAERGQAELDADTGLTPGGLPKPHHEPLPAEIATGMIVHQAKYSPAGMPYDEWVVDAGTSAEMRNLEKQVAQELGEWTEKQEISGAVSMVVLESSVPGLQPEDQARADAQIAALTTRDEGEHGGSNP